MRYPQFLQAGDTIGFIAPSFGCASEPYKSRFLMATDKFEKLGYRVEKGPNCYAADGIGKSSTAEKCGAEINEFFCNRKCDIIISCGGGETMCEDLNYVDFERIAAAEPKWYMGYSDNTNLTFILPTMCDTAAVYGHNAPVFGMNEWHKSLTDTMELLKGKKSVMTNYDCWEAESLITEETPFEAFNTAMPYEQKIYNANCKNQKKDDSALKNEENGADTEAYFEGRLLGGCLDCLINLCGTRFDHVKEFNERYKKDGIIWFLEACDLNPMGMRRALWQLKNAGWFDEAKGFLIGRSLHYSDDFGGYGCIDAVRDMLTDIGVPIVADIDIGHLPPRFPVISGALGTVRASGNTLELEMKMT